MRHRARMKDLENQYCISLFWASHSTKYWNPQPQCHTSRMQLTVKAGWMSVNRVAGERLVWGHKELSETGFTCAAWNVGWILIAEGSCSLINEGLMIFMMGNDPMKRGSIFLGASFR